MNIVRAGEEIKNTVNAYLARKEDGTYVIPPEKQRPILMIGPPGIGKTAIMRQIAEETGLGLVSYSMTHHTRQSAIGLPFITEAPNGQKVTKYTVSEIISSIWEYMERTGRKKGILFLDEINCVSETLTPVMLQLLQNKAFGTHPLPEDWVLVTAGNPPEYNSSVNEFDMVTLDRVRRMDVEADLSVWMDYAVKKNVHPMIRAYLSACPSDFYVIEERDDDISYVTARGWDDLSDMLCYCDLNGIDADEELILQYIGHERIARSFCSFLRTARSITDTDMTSFEEIVRSADEKRLNALSVRDAMCLSAVMFSDIRRRSAVWDETERTVKRRGEIISREQRPEKLLSLIASLREGMNAGNGNVRALVREKKILDMLEDAAADTVITDPSGEALRALIAAENDKDGVLMDETAGAVRGLTELYISVLEKCGNGGAALMYLRNDVDNDETLRKMGITAENA